MIAMKFPPVTLLIKRSLTIDRVIRKAVTRSVSPPHSVLQAVRVKRAWRIGWLG